ncbi:FAD:protein FMN transferase [Chloroflexota bacterium]
MNNAKSMGRRQFLRIIGVGALAGVALKTGLDVTQGAETVSATRLLMGTVVNLTLITDDVPAGQAAVTACLDEMAGLEMVMSRHRPDSQLTVLNRDGAINAPDARLVGLLQEAARLSDLTGGAFDVTIKPVLDLYQSAQTVAGALPAEDAVQAALALVDYRDVQVSPERIALARAGMGITLDGIAKGYIVDQGVAALKRHGCTNIMVEAGGDLAVSGGKSAVRPWRVGIQAPRQAEIDRLTASFNVSNQAVATSGDYMQPFTADFAEHHILHPHTGHSGPAVASATVLARSGAVADALATALLVMDIDQGISAVEAFADCESYMLAKDLTVAQSTGFPAML